MHAQNFQVGTKRIKFLVKQENFILAIKMGQTHKNVRTSLFISTFQSIEALQSETVTATGCWVYTGIIFVTISMQTADD